MSYSDLLKDPRWQRKRLEILESRGWVCENCGDSDKTLHVHHVRYVKGRMPWEYDGSELKVFCEKCHKERHDQAERVHALLSKMGSGEAQLAVSFIEAVYLMNDLASRGVTFKKKDSLQIGGEVPEHLEPDVARLKTEMLAVLTYWKVFTEQE